MRPLIWVSILPCSALFHSSSFLMTSGQWMPMMDLRHLLTKDCSFLELSLIALHVSEPYRRTDFTLVLNILNNLVFLDITFDLHTGLSIAKAVLAFPILASMSRSDPPSLLMLLPRYVKSSTSSIASPSSLTLSTFLVLTLITFVLDLLIVAGRGFKSHLKLGFFSEFPIDAKNLSCVSSFQLSVESNFAFALVLHYYAL